MDRVPSRRECLEAGALAAMAGFVTSLSPQTHPQADAADLAPYVPRLNDLRDRLHDKARVWAMGGAETVARPGKSPSDTFVYTVELAQLMEHFARAGDLEPYLKLRQFAVEHVIIDKADDPFTTGFVLWRRAIKVQPDASGTTEGLRMARALWASGKVLNRPQDKSLALTILDGYGRHYTIDQDIWLIRNYFSFGSRSFANNTYVIDYDADFLHAVADDIRESDPAAHKPIADLAARSYELMRRTPTPCGLLYDLVQPELKTMYWGIDVSVFSPNDIVQTNNACTTAATIAKGESGIARKVLAFVKNKLASDGKVYSHYYGRTGERVSRRGIRASETMAIAKLGALLDDKAAVAQFIQIGLPHWEQFVSSAGPEEAWAASEILLGLREVLAVC
ncbi:hypothetical protein [Humisphaera borealis]|uniref:Uncharacterized protein n=1 Tax=Humisphaera borealis TaxID=2807512 RepID=A0A7M2X357_9BACT|nr:hypothetical protein [Humisphaera borealis]QOV92153.1 hypothetical protein IPV69_12675 [Humisphaera borealis]